MASSRIEDIVRSLRNLESSPEGRQALASPRRGDYDPGIEATMATDADARPPSDDTGVH